VNPFLLKNLPLVAACLLAGIPYLLALLNLRRRSMVKRRALMNLLSDPFILNQYMDQFPAKKGLNDAEKIADDSFKTYYSRFEYLSALILSLLTVSAALLFILVRIGFPPPFLGTAAIAFVQHAAWGGTVLWALMGSYLWNCYDLIHRTANFNLPPDAFARMWLKFWVAAAVASVISREPVDSLQPALGFAIGLLSIPVLFEAMADKASKYFKIKTTEGDITTKIAVLQGATPDVIDTLSDLDIQSTVQLAYCDPITVIVRTNLAWVVIIDLIDQALLFNYLGSEVAKIRSGGYRGCIEVATIGANLNGDARQKLVGSASLSNFATLLGWQEPKALDLVQTLYTDAQVNLIWDLFGGNYRIREKSSVPDTENDEPDVMIVQLVQSAEGPVDAEGQAGATTQKPAKTIVQPSNPIYMPSDTTETAPENGTGALRLPDAKG